MEIKEIFQFLKKLQVNNNRDWFAQNKAEFERTRATFEDFVGKLIEEVALFDPEIKGLEPKDCIFRIYRDTRFSADKTPYKAYYSAYIASGGRKSIRGGYYLHLQPGECGIAGGIYGAETNVLKALRQSVYVNIDEFLEIMHQPEFAAYYKEMYGEKLKTVPRPFPKDFEYADWLKPKHYCVNTNLSDDFFCQADSLQESARIMKLLYPFNRFLNFTIDELYGLL